MHPIAAGDMSATEVVDQLARDGMSLEAPAHPFSGGPALFRTHLEKVGIAAGHVPGSHAPGMLRAAPPAPAQHSRSVTERWSQQWEDMPKLVESFEQISIFGKRAAWFSTPQ